MSYTHRTLIVFLALGSVFVCFCASLGSVFVMHAITFEFFTRLTRIKKKIIGKAYLLSFLLRCFTLPPEWVLAFGSNFSAERATAEELLRFKEGVPICPKLRVNRRRWTGTRLKQPAPKPAESVSPLQKATQVTNIPPGVFLI